MPNYNPTSEEQDDFERRKKHEVDRDDSAKAQAILDDLERRIEHAAETDDRAEAQAILNHLARRIEHAAETQDRLETWPFLEQLIRLEQRLVSHLERKNLPEKVYRTEAIESDVSARIYLTVEGEQSLRLTPRNLSTTVSPFLNAIDDIQHIFDEILGRQPREVQIRTIRQYSPISVSLDGAAEALQWVQNAVVPWRRKHAELMAHLSEQEKQADIDSKKAEVLEKHANAAKNLAEAQRLIAEAAKLREEAEKTKLENDRLRIEFERSKIQLPMDKLNHVAPNLSETERIAFLVKLLPPLDTVISSELQIAASTANREG